MEKHPLHLKNPELHTSHGVQRAVLRKERKIEEKVPNDPAERIEAYMDRLENIFLNPDERKRVRNLEMFRDKIYDALIIKRENFPDSYFELQRRVARERGEAVEEIPADARERMKDVAIEDQRHSLDAWIDYLSSDDAVYPSWFKYFVWRNIIRLSQFDKERGEFKERAKTTVAPFPDIYREPLAKIADLYERVKKDNKILKDPEIQARFSKKFPALYAELIQESLAERVENKEETRGEWVKYGQKKKGEAEMLFASLENKGTGWCTAGLETSRVQIETGDFYVYYTNDAAGRPVQPRLAIRMNGKEKIAEVRGILPHQNVEPLLQGVLDKKLSEFGAEADRFQKKSADMKRMTEIEAKTEQNRSLTREDLTFLYELDAPIEGFGYDRDPRIEEIRKARNAEEDMPVAFGCAPNQIARSVADIRPDTRAYVGPIENGIFQKIPLTIEYVYTSFPEGMVRRYETMIGGKTKSEYKKELGKKNIFISNLADDLLESKDFTTSEMPEQVSLIRLTVKDLGFSQGATTAEIYQKAEELGLELCPAEVGPALRLSYGGLDWMWIAMKQIAGRDGALDVFLVYSGGGRLELDALGAHPSFRWYSAYRIVFRLRKFES